MEINSKKVTVSKSIEETFLYLTQVKNFENLMPDNISKFEVIRENAFVFALKGMPEIALEIKETTPHNSITLGAISDKIPFTLKAQLENLGEKTTAVEMNFSGEFNAMMAMMIKGPITKFLDSLTTQLENS